MAYIPFPILHFLLFFIYLIFYHHFSKCMQDVSKHSRLSCQSKLRAQEPFYDCISSLLVHVYPCVWGRRCQSFCKTCASSPSLCATEWCLCVNSFLNGVDKITNTLQTKSPAVNSVKLSMKQKLVWSKCLGEV